MAQASEVNSVLLGKPDRRTEVFPILLRCPGIHEAPTVVTVVVEEGLIGLLMDDHSQDDWHDEGWYWGHLRDRLFDEKGGIILAAHGEELWDFMKDPEEGFLRYSAQIEELVMRFYKANEEKINQLYSNYELKTVKVIRAFRNQWLMLAEGQKL